MADTTLVITEVPTYVTIDDEPTSVTVLDEVTSIIEVGTQGPTGPAGSGVDLSQTFVQAIASATWVIALSAPIIVAQKVPVPTVIDTGGTAINGFGWTHDAVANTITLTFGSAFIGTAYLN